MVTLGHWSRHHPDGRQWCLVVVERVAEWVRRGVVDGQRREAEGPFGVGQDARERGRRSIGVTGPGIRADDDQGDARALGSAVRIDPWWYLIVEASAVVPGDEHGRGAPVRAVHHRGDLTAEPVVAGGHGEPVVLGVLVIAGGKHGERGYPAGFGVGGE